MLADTVKYAITSLRTGISGATRAIQTLKPVLTELWIGRQPIEHFQPINGHPSVIIGCNPRLFPEALGTVDTRSRLQSPQDVSVRDSLTMLSPLSLP
jgi:hypothetical protein